MKDFLKSKIFIEGIFDHGKISSNDYARISRRRWRIIIIGSFYVVDRYFLLDKMNVGYLMNILINTHSFLLSFFPSFLQD
jgi:hypothetical protein